MRRIMKASALVLGLTTFVPRGMGANIKGQPIHEPIPSPLSLTPPCYEPHSLPEADLERVMYGVTGLSFGIPKTFGRDSTARYVEGGLRWRDHDRTFELVNGLWGEESFGKDHVPVYLDCVDSLAGRPFRLIVAWDRSSPAHYIAIAVPIQPEGFHVATNGRRVRNWDYSLALVGRSPMREDLKLFLTIFRSMRTIDR